MEKNQETPSLEGTILDDETARNLTIERLQEHLPIEVEGYKISNEVIIEVVTHAAVTGTSIEASCAELAVELSSNSVREHLNAQVRQDNLEQLETSVSHALQAGLPRKARRAAREIAIDLHEQPFYGQEDELTCRGEAKAGTTRCYRMATAYLIHQGVRFTLGLTFVRPGRSKTDILEILLAQVAAAGVSCKRLWLDKGFASIPVYQLLERQPFAAVIACPLRGKPGGRGTKALCRGRKSYHTTHTFRHPEYGNCTMPVTVVRAWSVSTQGCRSWSWLVFMQLGTPLAPSKVRAGYRLRFGVESSYRCMRTVKAKTSTRNPAVRLLFMALGFVLVNVWILLRFLYCQIPKRGRAGRPLDEKRFRLSRFASFLRRAIERRYGVVTAIEATAPPIGV
jgi:putative transposase